ncbi:MAG: helix-turn-helix domain-containing protein [Actinomycetota bacterium]|nr:helix-turn-helix domain-containing protein [Actinomycetota bacterium]MDQ2957798.1 helix-turn-helix domain-containing protein [Actinomycetota bacterium]
MPVTGARDAPLVPVELADVMRPLLAELTTQIAGEISRQIAEYAREPDESYLETTRSGVWQAITYFVDRIADPAVSREEVDECFRRIGRGEAFAGRSLDALRSAYQIGARIAWKSLHALALDQGLPLSTLGELGDGLFDFMNELTEQSVVGFQEAQNQLSDAAYQWRERLLELILNAATSTPREINQLAATGNWTVPRELVMIVVERSVELALPPPRRLHPRTLANLRGPVPMVLHPVPCDAEARAELATIFAGHSISIGCPVPLADAVASLRWARRGMELMHNGVLPRQPMLDCSEHIATLWLHSEPLLRQRLSQSALAPLFRQAPNSRRIIAETMLAWLETRGSAPALAAHLGKHAQTIRYRLKRMHEIFGDDLDDDQRCFEMYLALRASMPLWKSGYFTDDLDEFGGRGRRVRPPRRLDS